MAEVETLNTLIRKAESNGFELRSWFLEHIAPDWPGGENAVQLLAREGRLSALIFSHEFARAFWKREEEPTSFVPALSYSRMNGHGQVITIVRKPFVRRKPAPDVWQSHLRDMVVSENPIAYLGRFLSSENCSSEQCLPARDVSAAV